MINQSNDPLRDYEQWHRNYNQHIVPLTGLTLMPWHESVLGQLGNDLAGQSVLEVGCGNGDFSNYLSLHRGVEITGIDFSPASIELARQKKERHSGSRARFLVADAQDLPFPDESFHLVISCECIEHVPNPKKMLQELYRVVKKGGKVVLTTENYSNAYAYYLAYLRLRQRSFDSGSSIQPIEHFFVFWRLKKKFREAGFRRLQTFSSQFVFLLLPGFHPGAFTVKKVRWNWLYRLVKPLGRRFTYVAEK